MARLRSEFPQTFRTKMRSPLRSVPLGGISVRNHSLQKWLEVEWVARMIQNIFYDPQSRSRNVSFGRVNEKQKWPSKRNDDQNKLRTPPSWAGRRVEITILQLRQLKRNTLMGLGYKPALLNFCGWWLMIIRYFACFFIDGGRRRQCMYLRVCSTPLCT